MSKCESEFRINTSMVRNEFVFHSSSSNSLMIKPDSNGIATNQLFLFEERQKRSLTTDRPARGHWDHFNSTNQSWQPQKPHARSKTPEQTINTSSLINHTHHRRACVWLETHACMVVVAVWKLNMFSFGNQLVSSAIRENSDVSTWRYTTHLHV